MATKKVVEPPKQEHPQKAIANILMRILAVFAASGLSVLGAGAVVGIETVQAALGMDTSIWCGDIDDVLNDKSYIVPGLGDAGDLAYGTKMQS